jgi:surfeit locus 1 family protein
MMRFGRYEFKPGLWPSMATLMVFPVLLGLGFWQLDRAEQKAALQAVYDARYEAETLPLNRIADNYDDQALLWRPVQISGYYLPQVYLLDNQVRDQQPGYDIFMVMELSGTDMALLVDRGWIAGGFDRSQVPAVDIPAGQMKLDGRVLPPPSTGIMLGEHFIEQVGETRYRIQRIAIDELRTHSGVRLLPYVVRLNKESPDSFRIDEVQPGTGRERHQGYAFQWFALSVTLLLIYFFVNVKKREE